MIRIEHLNKIYGLGETQVHALKDLNLVIAEGNSLPSLARAAAVRVHFC